VRRVLGAVMADHDHDQCHAIYDRDLDEWIYSLVACNWEGHDEAVAEHGWCPVCQH
jgi:hypothetical protein